MLDLSNQHGGNLADFTMKVGLTTKNMMNVLTCNHLQASYFDSVHLEVCLDIGRKMLDEKKESPLEFQELLAASFALQHPRYVYRGHWASQLARAARLSHAG
jgi:hypothetical protein